MNVFLIPAGGSNISKSIENPVDRNFLEQNLSSNQISDIKKYYKDDDPIYCWAMTINNRPVFSEMKSEDTVLITVKGTGKFNYRGVVTLTMECPPEFGNALWPFISNEPWTLVYFLKEVVPLDIDKSHLVAELGYQHNFQVQGAIKVRPKGVASLIAKAIEAI